MFLLAVAGIFLYITFLDFPRAPRVVHMQALSAQQVQASAPGEPVLVEGRISRDNPAQYANLVAYRLERAGERGSYSPYEWVRPPLLLTLPDGLVTIVGDYRMLHPPIQQGYASQEHDDYRYRILGFEADNPAVVIGTTQARAAGGIEVAGTILYGGSRAEFIAEQQRAALLGDWLAPVLIGGGLLLYSLVFVLSLVARVPGALLHIAGRLWRRRQP